MKTKLGTAVIVTASFICGCVVTTWGAWRIYSWMSEKEAWVRPCRDVVVDIRMIQDLKDGRVADVIEKLEMDVDLGLVQLSVYPGNGDDGTRKMVADTLQTAREHRKSNPRDIGEPSVRAAVESALAE